MNSNLLIKRTISPQENHNNVTATTTPTTTTPTTTKPFSASSARFHNGKRITPTPPPVSDDGNSESDQSGIGVKSGALIEQMFRARSSLDDVEKNYSVEIKDLNAEINSIHNNTDITAKMAATVNNKLTSGGTVGGQNKKTKALHHPAHHRGVGAGGGTGEEKFGLKFAMSLFKTVPFPSVKIEELYRRYFFHLNQHFINWFLVILILTCLCEIGLHFHFNRIGNFRYTRGIFLVVQVTVFAALLTIINWNGSSGRLLVMVSYIIVFFNSLMTVFNSVPLENDIHGVTKSMNYVIFTIYMTYVMLPLQFRMSICCGSLITLTHLITSISSQASTQKDVWWLVSLNLKFFG